MNHFEVYVDGAQIPQKKWNFCFGTQKQQWQVGVKA